MAVVWEYLVPHSFHPTLYVLFLTTFAKPLPERTCLSRRFKREERENTVKIAMIGVGEIIGTTKKTLVI